MESIIDFIFSNIFIIVVVISGLYSFFKRAGDGEELKPKKETTTNEIPTQVEKEWTQAKEIFETSMYPKESEQPVTSTIQSYNNYEQKKQAIKQEMVTVEKRSEPTYSKKSKVRRKKVSVNVASFSKSEVVEGVVYSEILQPPRAYNPHPATKRDRSKQKR
ncbi:hypothetical protein [Bacillus solimangrovi]|uniref:Uncharacterized protein n=1 Tax=Bacillus solimangrovi TaxID=1305675 RepID=A0A1E5LI08_9BACI|nr:hypothetical protein [Bacillus solimangrovi]OEH93698.1 hypothetical protein BFG57_11715 [Bacillus solimangrovi]